MPTYDYVCDACGHKFEQFQYFSEAHLKTCPKCQTDHLRRLFGTGAAVLFKGSGFYETDYRSSSYQDAAKADAPPSPPAASPPPPPATGTTSSSGPASGST
jgi:putative FmdB family regulatory protein